MAKETLLDSDVQAGKDLLKELDSANFQITTAMWFFYPDIEEWKLLLFSPKFKKQNPSHIYTEISKIITSLSTTAISIESVKVILESDSLLKMFDVIIRVEGISSIRMKSNYINGIYIEDALIYRNTK